MTTLNEDDLYRASTQYRLWSYTPAALASMRESTNTSAAQAVRAAIASKQGKEHGDEVQVDCLTVADEQKLVNYYCTKVMEMADFNEYPTNVKATAVQYIKRFYLSNSPMTYHPKEIVASALFLSTKTENHYTSLRSFASKLNISPDTIVAPEFLLTQGLRFAFDVRHPNRGLEGGFMELIALAKGDRGQAAKKQILAVSPTRSGKVSKTEQEIVQRIGSAHDKANVTLKTAALLTDVYFHFTPSQIWLSAFLVHDAPIVQFLVEKQVPSSEEELKSKILDTLSQCARMLEAAPSAKPGAEDLEELKRIDKKLYKCRNPEKIDLVGLNKAQKREGDDVGIDEKTVKKRKLERAKMEKEGEDLFGPALGKG